MGKNSGGSEINNANQNYQQLANDANQMVGYFQQYDLPMLQTLAPQLMNLVQGKPSALMNAAQAPVLSETARSINSLKTNPAGVVNPNALYSDMTLNGNQQAGIAGDQMLSQSLSAIQNLLGMGYGGASAGMSGLGNAAGGQANLGLNLNEQGNEWWKSILGAAGTYAGMSGGGGGGNPSAAMAAFRNSPISQGGVSAFGGAPTVSPDYSWMLGPSGTSSQQSTPISGSGNG